MSGESGESSGGEWEPEPEPAAAGCGPAAWGTAAPPVYESGCHRPTEPAGGGCFGESLNGSRACQGGQLGPLTPAESNGMGVSAGSSC